MEKIKISVIIPVYNAEKYLDRCIQSIQSQTLTDIEIICVNNGSTDTSLEILEKYAKEDSRILVMNHEKSSIGTARNIGISIARGIYVAFVDSDDFIQSTMFEKLYCKVTAYDADIGITNIYLYYEENHNLNIYRDIAKFEFLDKLGCFQAKEQPWIIENVGIWDKIYKNSFLQNNKLKNPENLVFEDHLFSFQALVLASGIVVLNEPLYYYRKNLPLSITGSEIINDKYKFDFLLINDKIRNFLIMTDNYPNFNKEYILYTLSNALWHQGNIKSYKNFSRFFNHMKLIITNNDIKSIKYLLNKRELLYIRCLKQNHCTGYYVYCRCKQIIKYLVINSMHLKRGD